MYDHRTGGWEIPNRTSHMGLAMHPRQRFLPVKSGSDGTMVRTHQWRRYLLLADCRYLPVGKDHP
jgi:hypothetical protein